MCSGVLSKFESGSSAALAISRVVICMFIQYCGRSLIYVLLVFGAFQLKAERYQVTTDAQGKSTLEQVESEASLPSRNKIQVKGVTDKGKPAHAEESPTSSAMEVSVSESGKHPVTEEELTPVDNGKSVSIFERKMLETEGKTRDELLKDLDNQSSDSNKVIVLDGIRYVDGNALLQDESLAEEGPRYFTAVDADGRQHNIYFNPEMEKRARNALREKPLQYTRANEYVQKEDVQSGSSPLGLEGAEPAALAILGSATPRDYFAEFADSCCMQLPNRVVQELQSGVVLFFDIKSSDSPYRFSEGDSRYVLVRLPDGNKDFAVRLKTFIKEFRRQDIDHGVFYPQVTMLSAEKRPLRILRDADFDFAGETWSSYGFLQGIFRISRESEGAEERFILIHTDRNALKKSSYFESGDGFMQVNHMPTGSVSIELYKE